MRVAEVEILQPLLFEALLQVGGRLGGRRNGLAAWAGAVVSAAEEECEGDD